MSANTTHQGKHNGSLKAGHGGAETRTYGDAERRGPASRPVPDEGSRAHAWSSVAAVFRWVFGSWLRPAGSDSRWEQR